MNRKKEKERGTLGVVSDFKALNTNDLSSLRYSIMEINDCSATSFSIKKAVEDKISIKDSCSQEYVGVLFYDTHTETKTTDSGSHDNIVSTKIPDKTTTTSSSEHKLQLPGIEYMSIHSHSKSKSKSK